jgi:hypothetical protein
VLLSPAIAPGTRSTTPYNHYSLLASIEDLFGLPRIGEGVGSNAFGPDVYSNPSGIVAAPSPSVGGDPPGVSGPILSTPARSGPQGRASAVNRAWLRALISRQMVPSGASATVARVIKGRGSRLRFNAPEPARVLVQWYEVPAGGRIARARRARPRPILIASGQALFRSAGTQAIVMKLTGAGKRLLEHAKRVRLTAKGTFTPRRGAFISATRTFVLRA